jgi:Flp pilus assembly secretin CpaC
MSVMPVRKQSILRNIRCTVVAAAFLHAGAASAASTETLNVMLDHATILKMPERVATLVVGNPLIIDVSIQPGGIMVLTGKGFGVTNLLALDRSGKLLMDK